MKTLTMTLLAIIFAASAAEAEQITACSKLHSSKCITATAKNGKVRLPGGTWVDCAGDCKNKLRSKTVDFWYEQKLRN